MKKLVYPFLCLAALLFAATVHAQDKAKDAKAKRLQEITNILHSLNYQQGEINLRGGLAKIQVPKEFRFLSPADAEKVLVKLWHNPPGQDTLGLLIPADKTPLDEDCWVVTLSYAEDGYVKDDDANKINYDDLLKKMQKQTHDANDKRAKEGYPTVELAGWAAPPHYDAATHKLYWAMDLKFDRETEHTLNYKIRMLGRRGVLVLNAVSPMTMLPEIEKQTPAILSMINFNEGNRYADFNPKVDKVATYGIAALVAGGIAAKLGFFKLIWVFILAAKKFIVIAFVAVAAWFKKLFTGDSKKSSPN